MKQPVVWSGLIAALVMGILYFNFNSNGNPKKKILETKISMNQAKAPENLQELEIESLYKYKTFNQDFPLSNDSSEQYIPPQNEDSQPVGEESVRVIIAPLYTTTLSSEVVITTVLEIPKRMGEVFQTGDLLMKLDDTIFKGFLLKAKGSLEKAQTETRAKEQLYHDNISSLIELKSAHADLAAAESEVISAQHSIDACTILAPYDGKVTDLFVEEYELVQQGKPLIEIVNDTTLIGKILVPSQFIDKLAIGKEINVFVKEINDTVKSKILRIDAVIDPSSSMIKVDVEIKNQDRKLRSGMIGIAQII